MVLQRQLVHDRVCLSFAYYLYFFSFIKDYSRRNNDIYLRQGATYHYDIIDMNGAYPRFLDSRHNDKHHSSNKRRQRRRNYHDRALSPIRKKREKDN